jgi:hypothetical protein
MSILNFKNTALSLLVMSIVAGCTSQVNNVQAPVNKANNVETIKVTKDQTIDLGDKDGKSVKVNLSLTDKQKFKIKNQFPTNTSNLPLNGSFLELHLYRTPAYMAQNGTAAGPYINLSPRVRFDAPPPADLKDNSLSGTVARVIIDNPGATNSVYFKGLQSGYYYYISARIYSPPLDISTKNWYANTNSDASRITNIVTPAVPGPGPETSVDLWNIGGNPSPSLVLNPTDIIELENGEKVQIANLPGAPVDNFGIYTAGSSEKLGNLFASPNLSHVKLKKLYRSIIGSDIGQTFNGPGYLGYAYTAGDGMAFYDTAPGGGTASAGAGWQGYFYNAYSPYTGWYAAYHSFHAWEEYVAVIGGNQLVIGNDDTLGNRQCNHSPGCDQDPWKENNQWDMEIFLMQSLTADNIHGKVTVQPGAYDAVTGTEEIDVEP